MGPMETFEAGPGAGLVSLKIRSEPDDTLAVHVHRDGVAGHLPLSNCLVDTLRVFLCRVCHKHGRPRVIGFEDQWNYCQPWELTSSQLPRC